MIIIPTTTGLGEYEQTIDLEGRVYLFRFSWNARIARWSLGIYTEAGDRIHVGILLVPGVHLLRKVADERRPPGILYILSTSGTPPGLYDLGPGLDSRLVYWTRDEAIAAVT